MSPQPANLEYNEWGFIVGYVCPQCSNPLKLHNVDDCGTKFFYCQKCGQISSNLKTPGYKKIEVETREQQRETDLDEIADALDTTIREDINSKLITFLAMTLNFTAENQQNIIFKSESSRGKSYIAMECASYFKEATKFLGYCSPTAFFHEFPTEIENHQRVVDLHQQILVFLDNPHTQLLKRLRPMLSHDKKEITYKITDRSKKQRLATKTVKLIGYPTVVFCSATAKLDEQELTRCFVLSPEATQQKFDKSIPLLIEKLGNPIEYYGWLKEDPQRRWLLLRAEDVMKANVAYIIIPTEHRDIIYDQFKQDRPYLQPRHQRDISRLISLIQAHALLNWRNRNPVEYNGSKTIEANENDVTAGFRLYNPISESNELGLSPEIYNLWTNMIQPNLTPFLTKQQIRQLYFKEYRRTLSKWKLEELTNTLEAIGLIAEEVGEDKRTKIFVQPLTQEGF